MNENHEFARVDLHTIELEARRLRAQATRDLLSALGRRVAALFAGRGLSGAKAA